MIEDDQLKLRRRDLAFVLVHAFGWGILIGYLGHMAKRDIFDEGTGKTDREIDSSIFEYDSGCICMEKPDDWNLRSKEKGIPIEQK